MIDDGVMGDGGGARGGRAPAERPGRDARPEARGMREAFLAGNEDW
jgi:hypothetical protein